MKKFTERLKELRMEKGLSQESLSKELGVGRSSITYWEKGLRVPSAEAIIILAKFFGVSSDYLLGLEN